jgi:hypothetical protein
VQRGATAVVSVNPSAKLTYGVYEGISLDDGDLLASSNTFPVLRKNLQLMIRRMVELDRELIAGLTAAGFQWSMGDDNGGHNMNIRTRYGGYYLDAGCSGLIIQDEIGTGYVTQEVLVEKLLGATVAKKICRVRHQGDGTGVACESGVARAFASRASNARLRSTPQR